MHFKAALIMLLLIILDNCYPSKGTIQREIQRRMGNYKGYKNYVEYSSETTTEKINYCTENYVKEEFEDIFTSYWPYTKIVRYLKYIACTYPDQAKLTEIGRTYENRTMYAITVWMGLERNNAIFVDAGMIAWEWISISLALYIIHSLVELDTNRDLTHIDWIILPVVNPDGYDYSFQNPKSKMWVKNRNPSHCPPKCRNGPGCGVNLYQNFGYMFSGADSSANPCSNQYSGPNPNSEMETMSIRKLLKQHAKEIKLYLSIHQQGAFILYPFSNNPNPIDDFKELEELAEAATTAINSDHNESTKNYSYGNYASVLKPSSGTSLDYVRGRLGVQYAYIIRLRSGKDDPTGFVPDATEILEIVSDCFKGIRAMALIVYDKHPPSKTFLRKLRGFRRRKLNGGSYKCASFNIIWIFLYINNIICN